MSISDRATFARPATTQAAFVQSTGSLGKTYRRKEKSRAAVGAPRRILLIDSSLMTRECLAYAFEARVKDFSIEAVARLEDAQMQDPEGILLDIKAAMASDPAILEHIAVIRERYANARIIILSDLVEAPAALAAIRNKLDGYVPTSLSFDLLVAALRLVLAGGVYVPMELIPAFIDTAAPTVIEPESEVEAAAHECTFTTREFEVLRALRQGKPNKLIAHELDIAASTVKVHIRNIMKKLNATNRTQIVLRTTVADQPIAP